MCLVNAKQMDKTLMLGWQVIMEVLLTCDLLSGGGRGGPVPLISPY